MWIIFANAQLIKAPFHDVTFKKLRFDLEGAIMKFLGVKATLFRHRKNFGCKP